MQRMSLSYAERLNALRARLQQEKLDGFLVPMADPYLNEYVPPSDRRIEYLTGFTGSSAYVLVLIDRAVFFTDSRYILQAQAEVPRDLFTIYDTAQKLPRMWMAENLNGPLKIGFDPRLHATSQIKTWQKKLASKNLVFHPIVQNPVDALWTDRPQTVRAEVVEHPEKYSGKSFAAKRVELAKALMDKGLGAIILTDPSVVAWFMNIRGGDIPETPVALASAIVRADGRVEIFLDQKERLRNLAGHLGPDVTVHEATELGAALARLGQAHLRVLIDPDETPYAIYEALSLAGAVIERGENPCLLSRACKNETEIDGMRAAHRRDGAALVKLLAWLDESLANFAHVTEHDVCLKLEEFRAEGALHKGPSFPTIAGSGPNGAIVHYRPTQENSRIIDRDNFLLLDSGAQYLDGTTDVTRTIVTGIVTHERRERFTRVLKGHIALAMIRFPSGTTGTELDVLAHQYLWEIGEDYGHGTGHGVGSYLGVHEGPQGISHRATCALRPGMVLSNEPGLYKPRHYGIRHENLQLVVRFADLSTPEREMLGFEPLTLAPFDKRAIDADMLTKAERAWLNAYHARVSKALLPQLDGPAAAWLRTATEEV